MGYYLRSYSNDDPNEPRSFDDFREEQERYQRSRARLLENPHYEDNLKAEIEESNRVNRQRTFDEVAMMTDSEILRYLIPRFTDGGCRGASDVGCHIKRDFYDALKERFNG